MAMPRCTTVCGEKDALCQRGGKKPAASRLMIHERRWGTTSLALMAGSEPHLLDGVSETHQQLLLDGVVKISRSRSGYLANVKIDLSRSASNVSEIGIGHLSWPVDNATHDRDLPGKYVYR